MQVSSKHLARLVRLSIGLLQARNTARRSLLVCHLLLPTLASLFAHIKPTACGVRALATLALMDGCARESITILMNGPGDVQEVRIVLQEFKPSAQLVISAQWSVQLRKQPVALYALQDMTAKLEPSISPKSRALSAAIAQTEKLSHTLALPARMETISSHHPLQTALLALQARNVVQETLVQAIHASKVTSAHAAQRFMNIHVLPEPGVDTRREREILASVCHVLPASIALKQPQTRFQHLQVIIRQFQVCRLWNPC